MNKHLLSLVVTALFCQGSLFGSILGDAQAICERHDAEVHQIVGNSMTPFFNDGDLVVVKPLSADLLRVGMIVVYENRFGEVVAHRTSSRTDEGWIVKGYNNGGDDSTRVTQSNLRGVVYAIFHVRKKADHQWLTGIRKVLAAPAR